jgi:glycosyltransferase involved in cell wall biosynthesis
MARSVRRGAGDNIRFITRLDFAGLREAYARCRALVFTAEEDFGIVPVEVMASGRPVLAYGAGGALETVVPEVTGMFFSPQTVDGLVDGIEHLEAWLPNFDPRAAVAHAAGFSEARFRSDLLDALEEAAESGPEAARRLILAARA